MDNVYLTALYGHGEDADFYKEMYHWSAASVRRFVRDTTDSVLLTGESGTISLFEMFKRTFWVTHDLWTNGANVLYLDVDTLVIAPVDIFGRFFDFRMFSPTSPPKLYEFDPLFNAGVRYFPAQMDGRLWDIGFEWMRTYDTSIWGYEQLAYNKMLLSQGAPPPFLCELNYGMPFDVQERMNTRRRDAKILHFHSSRDPKQCVKLMREYSA